MNVYYKLFIPICSSLFWSRKYDDPELYYRAAPSGYEPGMRLGGDNYMRASLSDGQIDKVIYLDVLVDVWFMFSCNILIFI